MEHNQQRSRNVSRGCEGGFFFKVLEISKAQENIWLVKIDLHILYQTIYSDYSNSGACVVPVIT